MPIKKYLLDPSWLLLHRLLSMHFHGLHRSEVSQRIRMESCPLRNLYSIPAGCSSFDFHGFPKIAWISIVSMDCPLVAISSSHRFIDVGGWLTTGWLAGWLAAGQEDGGGVPRNSHTLELGGARRIFNTTCYERHRISLSAC